MSALQNGHPYHSLRTLPTSRASASLCEWTLRFWIHDCRLRLLIVLRKDRLRERTANDVLEHPLAHCHHVIPPLSLEHVQGADSKTQQQPQRSIEQLDQLCFRHAADPRSQDTCAVDR